MSAAKHTPGPWSASEIDGAGWVDIYVSVAEEDGFVSRSLPFASCKHFDQEANARLIAAAPELLAALDEMLSDIGRASSLPSAIKAREAIAKATGAAQ